jgi:hypothetical protein
MKPILALYLGIENKTDRDIANSDHPIIEFHRAPKNQTNFNELLGVP